MHCLECAQRNEMRPAVALCHHCSAGLCLEHAVILTQPVLRHVPVCKMEEAEIPARLVLCEICQAALKQVSLSEEA